MVYLVTRLNYIYIYKTILKMQLKLTKIKFNIILKTFGFLTYYY